MRISRPVEVAVGLVLPLLAIAILAIAGSRSQSPATLLAFMAVVPMFVAMFTGVLLTAVVALATVVGAAVSAAVGYGPAFSEAIPVLVGVIAAAGAAVMASRLKMPVTPASFAAPDPRASAPMVPPDPAESADVDALTGLPTRARVLRDLTGPNTGAERLVALLDIDGLAEVNEAYGRNVGDVYLFAVAGRHRYALPDGDVVARWRDDGFLVIVPETTAELLDVVADKVNANPIRTESGLLPATVCLGAARWAVGADFEDAAIRARRALHVAKGRGPGCVVVDQDPAG